MTLPVECCIGALQLTDLCWHICLAILLGSILHYHSNPHSNLIPSNTPTLSKRERRLEKKGDVDLFRLAPVGDGHCVPWGKSNLHHQHISNLSLTLGSQPLDKSQQQPGAAGGAAAFRAHLRALSFIPSPESQELSSLQLANITPLLMSMR